MASLTIRELTKRYGAVEVLKGPSSMMFGRGSTGGGNQGDNRRDG